MRLSTSLIASALLSLPLVASGEGLITLFQHGDYCDVANVSPQFYEDDYNDPFYLPVMFWRVESTCTSTVHKVVMYRFEADPTVCPGTLNSPYPSPFGSAINLEADVPAWTAGPPSFAYLSGDARPGLAIPVGEAHCWKYSLSVDGFPRWDPELKLKGSGRLKELHDQPPFDLDKSGLAKVTANINVTLLEKERLVEGKQKKICEAQDIPPVLITYTAGENIELTWDISSTCTKDSTVQAGRHFVALNFRSLDTQSAGCTASTPLPSSNPFDLTSFFRNGLILDPSVGGGVRKGSVTLRLKRDLKLTKDVTYCWKYGIQVNDDEVDPELKLKGSS